MIVFALTHCITKQDEKIQEFLLFDDSGFYFQMEDNENYLLNCGKWDSPEYMKGIWENKVGWWITSCSMKPLTKVQQEIDTMVQDWNNGLKVIESTF